MLSDDEWARLTELEHRLLADDPHFAGRLDPVELLRMLRRRLELGWLGLAAGSMLLFLGSVASRGLISLGTVAAVSGFVLSAVCGVVIARTRFIGPERESPNG